MTKYIVTFKDAEDGSRFSLLLEGSSPRNAKDKAVSAILETGHEDTYITYVDLADPKEASKFFEDNEQNVTWSTWH